MRHIAIVGGGPAGAMCAARLAAAGCRVTLFDHRPGWEKPCGGGVTWKAIERYPFLLENSREKKLIRRCELIAGGGLRARLELDRPLVVYSRAVLNALLLERAAAAGCRVVAARVSAADVSGAGVELRTSPGETHAADFVVVAAGARNALLVGGDGPAGNGSPAATTRLERGDFEQTVGYFIPASEDVLKVKFLRGLQGYLWSFPRAGHLSVGVCGKMPSGAPAAANGNGQGFTAALRRALDDFCHEEKMDLSAARFYSHLLPSPQRATLRRRRVAGRNWALAGDAAAWVDPLTGEGIYYAMRSGELLAECLIARRAESYAQRARAEFAADLEMAARVVERFYRGRFLGAAVTTRLVQFARRSATFRQLVRDLFAGAQDYRSLKRRLWAQFGMTLGELAASALRGRLVEETSP